MLKSKMRLLGVSALVGAGLFAAGPANAANVSIGGFRHSNRYHIVCWCFVCWLKTVN